MNEKNIILIGFMGCGKTTVGKKIARQLSRQFIDTVKYIEKSQERTISTIFAEEGEAAFRQMEQDAAAALAQEKNLVIATGGGMVKSPAAMQALSSTGLVVYLKATAEQIYQNIGSDTTRPLLQTEDKLGTIRRMMAEREELYQRYANVTVPLQGHSISATCRLLLTRLEENLS